MDIFCEKYDGGTMSCERGPATLSRLLLRDAINNSWELNSKSSSSNQLVDYYGSLSHYGRSDSGFHSDSALSSPSPVRWEHYHKIPSIMNVYQ